MARIRTIKPEAFVSETLAEVSVETERTFFGLITQVDDCGRIKDQPAVLNGALWALRPDHTVEDMKHDLEELVRVGLLCRYRDDQDRAVMHLVTFNDNQVINKPSKPKVSWPCPVHEATAAQAESA